MSQTSQMELQIVYGVPESGLHACLEAMATAGAGVVGEYTHCSYTSHGLGHFRPSDAANPATGERGQINDEPEVRVETFCTRAVAKAVVEAIRDAHPYEEVVIYVIPLLDIDEL